MESVTVNYLAVLVAAIVNMFIGSIWYSKMAFADAWLKGIGKRMEDLQGARSGYVLVFIGSLLMAWVMAHVVQWAGATSFWPGVLVGFYMWLGFALPTMGANMVFEMRPRNLMMINIGYPLVALLFMGGILAAWH
jgi:hypothetical protein